MHFFYLDESGCTGADLEENNQPIFVMGGISLRDEGWNKTQEEFSKIIEDYFDGSVPDNFELHASELLSPNGEGPFEGHAIANRIQLTKDLLALIDKRKHGVHYFAIKKADINTTTCTVDMPYDTKIPFLLGFDYLITLINEHVKGSLGASARGMIILDEKDQFFDEVDLITHVRRFDGPKRYRTRWIAEISYPVDSRKNPMIQLSDLIVLCVKRFLEIEHDYRDNWPEEVKKLYAECYAAIHNRLVKKKLVKRRSAGMDGLNEYLKNVRCEPKTRWKQRYNITD